MVVIQETSRGHLNRKTCSTALSRLAVVIAGITACSAMAQSVEEVAVTGSRIRDTGMTSPTPVTSISRDELDNLSPGTLMDALDLLPQFLNSSTIEDTGSVAGTWSGIGAQSTLNMRGVGGNRTLVLLNGRRVVPSNRLSSVDISLFPQALIQRTEAVTGGASAAYGSDAIAGVTNFILNTNFEGYSADIQAGVTDAGDGDNVRASFATGTAIGDRSHFIIGADYYKSDAIDNFENRSWYRPWGTINHGATNGVPNKLPQREQYEYVYSRNSTTGGLITSGPLAGTQFLSDGTPAPFHAGEVLDSTALTGLNSGRIAGTQVGGSGDNIVRMVQGAQERYSVLGMFTHDLNDTTTLELQGLYGYSFVGNQKLGYSFVSPWQMTIYKDNAFLPESLRQRMEDAGVDSFLFNREVSPEDELYNAKAPTTTQMYSLTAALKGEIGTWNYDTYIQYGTSNRDLDIYGYRVDRWFRGVDSVVNPATGQIVCSSTLIQPNDGCVPINPFGRNNESQQARDWVHDSMFLDAELKQTAAEFAIDGELMQGWAGPIFLAAGVSYRKDELSQIGGNALGSPMPEPPAGPVTDRDANGNLLYRGLPASYQGYNLIDRAGGVTVNGGFEVYEAFAESLIPLARDLPFVQSADMSLATRVADYQGSGQVWAWKFGLDWQIVEDLRFRLTRSRDIRAGSLAERFDRTATGGTVTDRFLNDESYTIRSIQGGNAEVEPENADTVTFGLVYRPNQVPGLSLSWDYFDISISDAITQIGTQNIMDDCYDYGAYCNQIQRLDDGKVDAIYNVYINVGEARTRGMDYEVSYRGDLSLFGGEESFNVRAIASRLLEASTTPYGSDKIEAVGNTQFPDWTATLSATYMRGNFSLNWTERFRSEVVRNLNWVEGIDVDYNTIGTQRSTNLRATYNFDTDKGDYSVYAAVTNLMNYNPSRSLGLSNIWGNLGRSYAVGMRYNY